jgi:hypothetical protein
LLSVEKSTARRMSMECERGPRRSIALAGRTTSIDPSFAAAVKTLSSEIALTATDGASVSLSGLARQPPAPQRRRTAGR